MSSSPGAPGARKRPVWLGVGAILVVLVLAVVFVVLVSNSLRHELRNVAPPAQDVPKNNPEIPN